VKGETVRLASFVRGLLALGLVLVLFAIAAYGPRLGLAFVGDDYVFLAKTRWASFARLWSPATSVDFGWYRPWARELHFWALQHLAGSSAVAFRVVNVALWTSALCLYAAIVARLASRWVAAVATLGVATLAFWGTPLLWVSGSQDLWMLVFVLLSFLLVIADRPVLALPCFALGLLSKETAGVLPAILCAYFLIVRRDSWAQTIRATAAFWITLLVWATIHPTLRHRLFGGPAGTAELEHRPTWSSIVWKSVATGLNLDRLPHPQEVDAGVVFRVIVTVILLSGALLFARRRYRGPSGATRGPLVLLACAWAVIGWAPLLLPTIGWHAYYGCVGALGMWFALALGLESRPAVAIALVAALALLRGAQANTLSSDWGAETYFCRAGSTLEAIRTDLLRQRPTLPRYSRVYFSEIPHHIGLIAGESPALRVWYADSSLRAGYYSYYQPRAESEPRGSDYFFRFDSASGMVEVETGAEDVRTALARNPRWEPDHEELALLFMQKRDLKSAARQLERLSLLPHRPGAAVYAAECYELLGDGATGDSLLHAAQVRLHATDAQMRELASRDREEILLCGGAAR
jgi:hypothetical protein